MLIGRFDFELFQLARLFFFERPHDIRVTVIYYCLFFLSTDVHFDKSAIQFRIAVFMAQPLVLCPFIFMFGLVGFDWYKLARPSYLIWFYLMKFKSGVVLQEILWSGLQSAARIRGALRR